MKDSPRERERESQRKLRELERNSWVTELRELRELERAERVSGLQCIFFFTLKYLVIFLI